MLQYLTPGLQMAWGVLVLHEDMPASRWIGFGLIWTALAVFTVDAVLRARTARGRLEPVTSSTPE
jgi:chloramphenicol-sensitive protein RarD